MPPWGAVRPCLPRPSSRPGAMLRVSKGVVASLPPPGAGGKKGWVSGLTHPSGQSWLKEGRGGGEQSGQEPGKWEADAGEGWGASLGSPGCFRDERQQRQKGWMGTAPGADPPTESSSSATSDA